MHPNSPAIERGARGGVSVSFLIRKRKDAQSAAPSTSARRTMMGKTPLVKYPVLESKKRASAMLRNTMATSASAPSSRNKAWKRERDALFFLVFNAISPLKTRKMNVNYNKYNGKI